MQKHQKQHERGPVSMAKLTTLYSLTNSTSTTELSILVMIHIGKQLTCTTGMSLVIYGNIANLLAQGNQRSLAIETVLHRLTLWHRISNGTIQQEQLQAAATSFLRSLKHLHMVLIIVRQ